MNGMHSNHPEGSSAKLSSRFIALAVTLLIVLGIFQCWIVLSPHWLAHDIVPPGDDPAVHLRIITAILDGHGWLAGLPYPPLFHWLVASLAFVTHFSALKAQWLVTNPMIGLVPTGIAGIFITRQAKGKTIALLFGLMTLAGLMMLSRMPLRAWGDGNYPDILAEGILIPLMLYCLSLLHGRWNRWIAGLTILFLSLVFATHAMSILIALATFFFGVLLIDLPLIRRGQLLAGAALLVAIAWIKVVGPTLSFSTLQTILQGQGNIVSGLSGAISQSTPLANFGAFFGQPFLSIVLVLLLLAITIYIVDSSTRYTLLLLGIWAASLFLVSRIHGLAVPDRFLRDLSYPLIALGATSITILARRQLLAALPITILIVFAGLRFATYINHQPGTFLPHPDGVRPVEQRVDLKTAILFKEIAPLLPASSTVLTNPTNDYAPYLIGHPTTVIFAPLAPQAHEYYLILGPEPGGSLRSTSERQFYQDVTTQLRKVKGRIVITKPGITILLVPAALH
jgi:hypothetical protein